jgi:hypothetical protein
MIKDIAEAEPGDTVIIGYQHKNPVLREVLMTVKSDKGRMVLIKSVYVSDFYNGHVYGLQTEAIKSFMEQ